MMRVACFWAMSPGKIARPGAGRAGRFDAIFLVFSSE